MTEKVQKIIEQIARTHHVTPEQVESDMKSAIREGMSSSDPNAQALWHHIAPDGKEPSIDSFLSFCAMFLEMFEKDNRANPANR